MLAAGTCFLDTCHLFAKTHRPARDSKITFSVFRVMLPPVVLSNCSKAEAFHLSALPKDTTSKLADLSSLYLFNAERQARKL